MATPIATPKNFSPPSEAMELVQAGEALFRVENETMLRVSIERPRDEEKVLAGALRELDLYPDEAHSAYYSIPYKDGDGGKALVEGLSINAALALARRWGNCAPTARIVVEDAAGVTLAGVFVDYETMFRVEKPLRVSRFFRRRNGSVEQLDVKRFEMAVQAGASKVLRNAVLSGLPAGLRNAYFKKAKTLVAGGNLAAPATLEQVAGAIDAFAKYGVNAEDLEKLMELPRQKWAGEQIGRLRGLYRALEDEQTTVADLLGAPEAPPGAPTPTGLDQATEKLRAERSAAPGSMQALGIAPPTSVTNQVTLGGAGEAHNASHTLGIGANSTLGVNLIDASDPPPPRIEAPGEVIADIDRLLRGMTLTQDELGALVRAHVPTGPWRQAPLDKLHAIRADLRAKQEPGLFPRGA